MFLICGPNDWGTIYQYNSCRLARELWIEDRKRELLPVRYQHIVFTIPSEFNDFCCYNPNFCCSPLFRAEWKTMDTFAKDKNGLARTQVQAWFCPAVLRDKTSCFTPYVHCIVPSGGLDGDGNWISSKGGHGKAGFLFPVKAMSKVFRASLGVHPNTVSE